ncbi:MAG TPA: PRC-barrel domain-containing protein [Terracidiphilus sp.]|nr:PRC-barrel domain-containing protein [Terracidiphilus sp.]
MSISNLNLETETKKFQNSGIVQATRVSLVRDLSSLIGAPVVAINGEAGRVRDFLFDDESWQVRHVVLDVGSWLRRRDVVVPESAFRFPNWERKLLRVRLTRAEVRNCPDIDSERPVWRQQAIAMRKYFGALACWVDTEFGLGSMPTWVRYPAPAEGNPHLRSVRHLIGYRVRATDGYFGRLNGFLVDEDSWHLGYAEVSVPRPLQRIVAVPTSWVDRISWAEFRVYLHHQRISA